MRKNLGGHASSSPLPMPMDNLDIIQKISNRQYRAIRLKLTGKLIALQWERLFD